MVMQEYQEILISTIKFKDFENFKIKVNKLLQDKIREIRYKE